MTSITKALQKSIMVAWSIWAVIIFVVAYWAIDRTTPVKIEGYSASQAAVGTPVVVDIHLHRDLTRACSSRVSRYIVDSTGARTELGVQYTTPSSTQWAERTSPGRLKLSIPLPAGVKAGSAKLVTTAEYVCNPVQRLWPLDSTSELRVEVLNAAN